MQSGSMSLKMLDVLHHERSLGFYRKIALTVPDSKIFEAISVVNRFREKDCFTRTVELYSPELSAT